MAADCSNTVSDLAPCLPVVTGSGGAPDGACCRRSDDCWPYMSLPIHFLWISSSGLQSFCC
ncbi:hypothetical protein O6H91_01G086100 [Diphasiastrum complanatum]|nr:hypothetical protein O6H91_01G086100 [Diphasiastrum complanatum]